MSTRTGPERWQLGFRETVLSKFEFLHSYGFRPVEQNATFVRYESDKMFLNIYHGRTSYELGIELGRLANPAHKLYLTDVIAWAGADEKEGLGKHTTFQVNSVEGVRVFVAKLADLMKKYAVPLLQGDESSFRSAMDVQEHTGRMFMKQMRLSAIRQKADVAWKEKDFAGVIQLYESMRDDVTEVEAKRLTYARKHVADSIGHAAEPSK